jgi:hypothetical protein
LATGRGYHRLAVVGASITGIVAVVAISVKSFLMLVLLATKVSVKALERFSPIG